MVFLKVVLKEIKKPDNEIEIVFPTSVIKDLFPHNREYQRIKLINTVIEAKKKCKIRLLETGNKRLIDPMCDICNEIILNLGLKIIEDGERRFKVINLENLNEEKKII